MRRLHGQTLTTAGFLADNLDELSNFMGQEDQANIDAIHARLAAIDRFPDSYRDVVALSREVIQLYQDLLDNIGDREGFEDQGDGP